MNEIEQAIEYFNGYGSPYDDIVIQALQEKAERENGCRWCNPKHPEFEENCVSVDIWDNRKEYPEWEGTGYKFCPMCGRKLVEE